MVRILLAAGGLMKYGPFGVTAKVVGMARMERVGYLISIYHFGGALRLLCIY